MDKVIDPFMDSLIKGAQTRRGSSRAILASDFHKYQMGVKIPHLMMEYLFGLNVIPCSSIIELAGLPKSCKSAFLQYLFRMYADLDYRSILIETEGKLSSTLLQSFLDDKMDTLFLLRGPLMQEEWQQELLKVLKMYRAHYAQTLKAYDKTKGKEHLVVPYLIGLDSLGGSPSQDSVATVEKAGSADRSFPIEALKNKIFFEQLPTRLLDLPLTVVYTNHEKPEGMGEAKSYGPPPPKVRKSKGGATPSFFCGLRIFFEQASKPQQIRNGVFQQTLQLEVGKNSFNQSGTRMALSMEWTEEVDPETNNIIQHTTFLWNKALAQWLAPSVPGFKYDREAVKKFLTVTRSSDTKFSCKELKLKDVTPEEIGDAIEANDEIREQLRPYMGIKTWRVWDGTPIDVDVQADVDLPDPEEALEEAKAETFNIEDNE